MLSTEKPLKDMCSLSPKQLNWLEEGLKAARKEDPKKPIFVFSHQALNGTHLRSEEYGGFGDESEEVLNILNKFSNVIFLSGHIHNGLGVAQELTLPFGYAFDLASYCWPDNGLMEKSIGYYVKAKDNTVTFTPYFLGDLENKEMRSLPLYEKKLTF